VDCSVFFIGLEAFPAKGLGGGGKTIGKNSGFSPPRLAGQKNSIRGEGREFFPLPMQFLVVWGKPPGRGHAISLEDWANGEWGTMDFGKKICGFPQGKIFPEKKPALQVVRVGGARGGKF